MRITSVLRLNASNACYINTTSEYSLIRSFSISLSLFHTLALSVVRLFCVCVCVNARVCFCCSCSINQSNELNSLNGKAFCCCQCYVVHRITDSICTIFLASVSDLNPGWRSLIHISSCHISDESVKNITYSFQSIIQQQKHQTATTCHFFIRFGYGILLKWITHIIWIPQALQKRKTLQLPAIRIKKNDVIFKNGILYVIKIWIRMLELLHYFLIVKCLWKNSISYSYRLNSIKKPISFHLNDSI